jgi:hypothetical protein
VRRSFDLVGRFSEFLSGFTPRTLAYGAAAAAVILFLQSAALLEVAFNKGQPDTVTAPQLANAESNSNIHAVIRFSPQATSDEIVSFLNVHSAKVVDGPGGNRLFNIRFTSGASKDEIARNVQRMQSETKVVEFIAVKQ